MPQIIVIADGATEDGQPPVMLHERVNQSDFESQHFAHQLVERIGWAVGDAEETDRRQSRRPPRRAGFGRLRAPGADAHERADARQRADAHQLDDAHQRDDAPSADGGHRDLAFSGRRPAPPEW